MRGAQKIADERVELQRQRAAEEGTEEFNQLQQINLAINAQNTTLPRKNHKKAMTPPRLYPFKKIIRENEKGGMDFVWYAFEVLEKELFPYFNAVKANNPDADVYIIEDNLGSHGKARELLAAEIEKQGIKFVDVWPPNSPDLHRIEILFASLKREIRPYSLTITSASKKIKAEAAAYIHSTWIDSTEFQKAVERLYTVEAFQKVAQKAFDCGGNNDFNENV